MPLKSPEEVARICFTSALGAVQPQVLMAHANLKKYAGRRVVVVGAGKAAMAMAGAVEDHIPVAEGLVVVPHGYKEAFPTDAVRPFRIKVREAGHPVPDAEGHAAAQKVLLLAQACERDDVMIVLLSGGGSALLSLPAAGISLDDLRETNRLLLNSGASIGEINAVRKHLSRIKGGQLAAAASPATVVTLALSDVAGDDAAVIASGPTVPDPTTFAVAVAVLYRYDLWNAVPLSVRLHLQRGQRGGIPETPKPGNKQVADPHFELIGRNSDAVRAAAQEAIAAGYRVEMREKIGGEAREVGRALAAEILDAPEETCLVWGGETTVTVSGKGRGGRNQEVVLGAMLAIEGNKRPVAILSAGTDGIDGPTDAAGAVATPRSITQARHLGLSPEEFLKNNDAYPLLQQVGALIKTGPTHTNVADVMVALVGGSR